jgi:hypothetical protein
MRAIVTFVFWQVGSFPSITLPSQFDLIDDDAEKTIEKSNQKESETKIDWRHY